MKRDVLRRFMGHRWQLRPGHGNREGAAFTAFNEIPVVFAGDEEVEEALKEFRRLTEDGFRYDCLYPLAKALAKSAEVPDGEWTPELIENPLAPEFLFMEMRRDVLRRFMGHRWHLTLGHGKNQDAFFTALNEIPVAFAGDEEVKAALNKLKEFTKSVPRNDDIVNLAMAMAKSAEVPDKGLTEDIIQIPFTPKFPDPAHVKIPPRVYEHVAAAAKCRGVQQEVLIEEALDMYFHQSSGSDGP